MSGGQRSCTLGRLSVGCLNLRLSDLPSRKSLQKRQVLRRAGEVENALQADRQIQSGDSVSVHLPLLVIPAVNAATSTGHGLVPESWRAMGIEPTALCLGTLEMPLRIGFEPKRPIPAHLGHQSPGVMTLCRRACRAS